VSRCGARDRRHRFGHPSLRTRLCHARPSREETAAWPAELPPRRCDLLTGHQLRLPARGRVRYQPRLRTVTRCRAPACDTSARRDDQRRAPLCESRVPGTVYRGCAHVSFAAPFANQALARRTLGLARTAVVRVCPRCRWESRDSFRCGSSRPPDHQGDSDRANQHVEPLGARRTRRRRAPRGPAPTMITSRTCGAVGRRREAQTVGESVD
jgi:hypothetical protein